MKSGAVCNIAMKQIKQSLPKDLHRNMINTAIVRYSVIFMILLLPAVSFPGDQRVLFRDDFDSLENWKPFYFPKINTYSSYSVIADRNTFLLKTESSASASALIYKNTFNVYDFPRVRWRWKVENVYYGGDAKTKSGDDYPLRIYIMFEFIPDKATLFEKLTFGIAKTLYKSYPPHSSLNYIWANRIHDENMIISPYTDRSVMIVLEEGTEKVGTWVDEEVNIIRDYKRAFGTDPPEKASIAIMNDSDNTQEASISYMDFIEVLK